MSNLSANMRQLLELDESLVRAVFAPPLKNYAIDEDAMQWQHPNCVRASQVFLNALLPVSEYYQKLNPPLSAALWGIWNTWSYLLFRDDSWFNTFFLSTKLDAKRLKALKALVATAAVQFADGTAITSVTSNPLSDIDCYKSLAGLALSDLRDMDVKQSW